MHKRTIKRNGIRNLLLTSTFVVSLSLSQPAKAITVDDFFNAASSGNISEVHNIVDTIKAQIAASAQYDGYQINLDFTDSYGNTPLMKAAESGHVDVVDFLMSNGANPNLTNFNGETAFTLAQKNGQSHIVNYYAGGFQSAPAPAVTDAPAPRKYGKANTSSSDSGLFSSDTLWTLAGAGVIAGGAVAIGSGGGGSGGDDSSGSSFDASTIDDPASDTPADFITAETANNEGIANMNAQFAHAKGYDGRVYNRNADGSLVDNTADDNIIVGVFDSGADLDHPDLDANILAGLAATCAAGSCAAGGEDADGHGTSVAGVIAAERNGVGTAGVAPNAEIIPINFTTVSDLVAAIDYANPLSVSVFNFSFGFTALGGDMIPITTTTKGVNVDDPITQTELRSFITTTAGATDLISEIQTAINTNDTIIVVAAGNEGADQVDFLAGLPFYFNGTAGTANVEGYDWSEHWVTSVSVDDSNVISSFSNECGVTQDYCLAAPGEITSTTTLAGGYTAINGTSFSAPNVAGAIAVMLGAYPHLDPEDVLDILFETATDLGAAGTDAVYGRGLVNLEDATTPTDGGWTVALSSTLGAKSASFTSTGLNLSRAFGDAVAKNNQSFIFLDAYNKDYSLPVATVLGSSSLRKSTDEIFTDFAKPLFAQETETRNGTKMAFTLQQQEEGFLRKNLSDYSEDDESKFSLQYGLANSNVKSLLNYNVNVGDVAGFSSFSKMHNDNLLVSDAFKNPYLTMVDHSKATGSQYISGDMNMKFMLFDGETEREQFEFADSNRIRGFVSEVGYSDKENGFDISLQAGANIEEETFLGAESGGALALDDETKTYYSGLAARYSPAKDFYINANYNVGVTKLNESQSSLIYNVSDIMTNSFAVGAELHNLYNNNDRFGISISQPLRVSSADASINLPQDVLVGGNIVYDSSKLSLTPQGREVDIEAFYDIGFEDSSKLSIGSMLRIEPDHIAEASNEGLVLLKYKTSF